MVGPETDALACPTTLCAACCWHDLPDLCLTHTHDNAGTIQFSDPFCTFNEQAHVGRTIMGSAQHFFANLVQTTETLEFVFGDSLRCPSRTLCSLDTRLNCEEGMLACLFFMGTPEPVAWVHMNL
jgi:hypothetical protein